MTKFILIHGAYGSPKENWFPWLREELERLGHDVLVPLFPTPKNQNLISWLSVMEEHKINEETILISHSVGCAFVLSLLEKHKIKAAFFVAGWVGSLGKNQFDSINKTITNKKFNFNKIKESCSDFFVYGSDNDLYVSLKKEKYFANRLNVDLKLVSGAGHFNEKVGYMKFELLLDDINTFLFQNP